ncbi:MAG: cytochrome c oxidase subunit II [bacterium]|jgi:cytochrome c oxidase subunit 2|nr:cytochrome c oxidase subunit II [bacterium]
MTKGPSRLRRVVVAALAATPVALLAAAVATPVGAASGVNPIVPEGVSPNGQNIHWLYLNLISPFAIIVFLVVEGLLLTIILKWRRSRLPADYQPPQWHGHTVLEVTWTVIPFLILCVVGFFSFRVLQQDFVRPTDSVTNLDVHIVAHQYGWQYEYPGGVVVKSEGQDAASNPLVLPQGQMVRLRLDSQDVIHSFWVPDITGKTDAVPGYSNYTWMKIDRTGEWRGECAELCGAGHATMQIRVKAVSDSEFQSWLAQKKKAASASASPKPSPAASPTASPAASPAGSPSPSPSPST